MAQSFTCPHGHTWEDPWGDGLSLAAGGKIPCPICGAPTNIATERGSAGLSNSAFKPTSWSPGSELPQATLRTQEPDGAADKPLVSVPGYVILSELGRGGMGVVYKARQVALKRVVALKMILAGAHASQSVLARFRAEAEAVARLKHPNIVQVYEIGEHESRPFFAMEFVEGRNLFDQIHDKPLPAKQTAQLVAQLARAMHAAHQAGIIHRDLKPANVLLAADGTPKITDFGLAKDLGDAAGQTKSGEIMGTPSYMAPEQAEGRIKLIGPPTDIYSLGAILYEMLTCRPPFRAETAMDTLLQVLYEEPMPPARLLPGLPRDLETICLKCLNKEIAQRYATAEALAEDLERFVDGRPIEARPVSLPERALKWARRRPTAAALLTVSVVAPLVVLYLSLSHNVRLNDLNRQLEVAAANEKSKAEEAETARDKARYQEGLAKKRQKDAEEQRNIAEQQRRRAEENFRAARQAVRTLLTEVAQSELAQVPLMEDVRQRLLARAVEFHSQFLEKQSRDPAIRQQAGLSYQQLGSIYTVLGRSTEAEDAFREAIQRFAELARDFPDEPEHRRELAVSHFQRGQMLRGRDQFADAGTDYREAIRLQDELTKQVPANRDYRSDLGHTVNDLALVLSLTGRPKDAEDSYARAIALQEQLVLESGGRQPQYVEDVAGSYNDRGLFLRASGERGEAERSYLKARDQFQRLVEEYPRVGSYRQKLAAVYNNLGNVLNELKGPKEGEEPLRAALKLRQKLTDDFPSILAYRQEVADTHANLAVVLAGDKTDKKRLPDAEKEATEALTLQRKLADTYPSVPDFQAHLAAVLDILADLNLRQGRLDRASTLLDEAKVCFDKIKIDNTAYRRYLRNHNVTLAETLLRRGEKGEPGHHVTLAKVAAELPKFDPDKPDPYRQAAVILTWCVNLTDKDPKLVEGQRKPLREQYAQQAVQWLRQAVQRGYADLEQLKMGKVFDPLRSRDDFQRLLREVEEQPPKKP